MATLLESLSEDLADRFSGAVKTIEELMDANSGDTLFRRFKAAYATLPVEDIVAVQKALGHSEGETEPCKVCREMAKQELALDDIG
jgi:hypothetical protein